MKLHLGFAAIAALACVACNGGGGTAGGSKATITLAGNSVARPVFEKGLIPAFTAAYEKSHPGQTVEFKQSYEGSGAQMRAIQAGLKADIAALTLSPEIDKLAENGVVSKDWATAPGRGIPATSVVVLVVRKGNPKAVKDWNDLTRSDVDLVLPNPDTSGAAQWNIAAIDWWASGKAFKIFETTDDELTILKKVRARVKAFGKSGKEAQQIFSSGLGDVLVGWELEALERIAAGDPIEIVYPSTTIKMEPPVAVVTPKGSQANSAAQEFLEFLYTPEAQRIYAQHHYRPTNLEVAKEVQKNFPAIKDLVTIEKIGGWQMLQKGLFGPDGLWNKAAQ